MEGPGEVHGPYLGALAILHDVHGGAHVDDRVSTGGDLRVRRVLELEDVHGLEAGLGGGGGGDRRERGEDGDDAQGG